MSLGVLPRAGSCHADAMRLLREHRLTPSRIVDVQTDGILWLDQAGRRRTTFVEVSVAGTGGLQRKLHTEKGFAV